MAHQSETLNNHMLAESIGFREQAPLSPAHLAEQQRLILESILRNSSAVSPIELEVLLATSGFDPVPELDITSLPADLGIDGANIATISQQASEKLLATPGFTQDMMHARALHERSIGARLGMHFQGELMYIPPCADDILYPALSAELSEELEAQGKSPRSVDELLVRTITTQIPQPAIDQLRDDVPYLRYLDTALAYGKKGFDRLSFAHLAAVVHDIRSQNIADLRGVQVWIQQNPDRFRSDIFGQLDPTSWQAGSILMDASEVIPFPHLARVGISESESDTMLNIDEVILQAKLSGAHDINEIQYWLTVNPHRYDDSIFGGLTPYSWQVAAILRSCE